MPFREGFPKSQRWILAKPIADECIAALSCIRRANAVYVQTVDDWKYRRSQQVQAHSHLDTLLSLIDVAYGAFAFPDNSAEHWTKLTVAADEKLKSWMKSDKERYTKQLGL